MYVTTILVTALSLLAAAAPPQLFSGLYKQTVVDPDNDAFYTAPTNLSAYTKGAVIRSRPTPKQLAIFGAVPITVKRSTQLLYRTTDSKGDPQAAVTTIIEPQNADYGKLLSYQIEYDSAWNGCSPSVVLQRGTDFGQAAGAYSILFIAAALNQGWVVSTSDYEGPRAAFTAGLQSGRATLDSIKAALASGKTTALKPDAKVTMWGYSGGALATEWAAELAPTYAPELKILGAAMGGLTPNVTSVVYSINKTPLAGLAPAGMLGLANAYPELDTYFEQHIIPSKRTSFYKARSQCLADNILQFLGQDISTYFDNGFGALSDAIPQAILLDGGIMGRHGIPQIPLYFYKAIADQVSRVADTDALISQYCAAPNKPPSVAYVREVIGDHVTATITGSGGALRFLKGLFDGQAPLAGCWTQTVLSSGLDVRDAPLFGNIIFASLVALLGKPLGPLDLALEH